MPGYDLVEDVVGKDVSSRELQLACYGIDDDPEPARD